MTNNPYAAPQSNPQASAIGTSGSLETGVQGRYDLTGAMGEAWTMVNGSKLPLVIAALVSLGVSIAGSWVLRQVGLDGQEMIKDGNLVGGMVVSTLAGLVLLPLTMPLWAAAIVMGVRRAAGAEISAGELFSQFSRMPKLVVTGLISTLLTYVGMLFCILPGIYLSIAWSLAIPLIVDKGLSPWQALETSRKALTHQWFGFFGVCAGVGILAMLSAIPLGIGLIWTLPWCYLTIGVIYRRIFGVEPATLDLQPQSAGSLPAGTPQ